MPETLLRLFGMQHRCRYCGDRIWSFYYYVNDAGQRAHGPCYAINRIIDACTKPSDPYD